MLETLISILILGAIAGWIFYDAYNKKRYSKWPSIAWTVGALIFPFLVLLFYLLFRPPQERILKKEVAKIDPEFMEKKYRLLDNVLMVIAVIMCGEVLYLLGGVVPTFTKMFQEVELSLPVVSNVISKIALILGHWVWLIGFLLLAGIIFFFKHPRLVRFHRRHAPRSYVDYILIVVLGSRLIIGLIVISMYLPIFEMSTMIE